jgi:hypothetical protein
METADTVIAVFADHQAAETAASSVRDTIPKKRSSASTMSVTGSSFGASGARSGAVSGACSLAGCS